LQNVFANGFRSILCSSLLIATFCAQAGAEDRRISDPYGFLKSQVEQYGKFEHLRFGTVGFSKLTDRTCPTFTANINSYTDAFVLHTPTYSSLPYPHVNETTGHSEIIASTKNCRYVFSFDKFKMSGNEQTLIPHQSQSKAHSASDDGGKLTSTLPRSTEAQNLKSSIVIGHDSLTLSNKSSSIIDVGGADPDLSGISTAGAFWSNGDRIPEYSGILYCATRNCSLLVDNATEYDVLNGPQEVSSPNYIDVIGRTQKLRISVKRQIFKDEWIDDN
jgi:hypothetical protein